MIMDLNATNKEFESKYGPKWFEFNNSSLKIGYAPELCPILISKNKIEIDLYDLISMLSEKVLTDWKGVLNPDGSEIAFSKKAAFNALKIDENFLKLVTSTAFDASNF